MSEREFQEAQEQEARSIELGHEAMSFLGSKLGSRFVDKAVARRQAALEGLGQVDPGDRKEIERLQNEVRSADYFKIWVDEILNEARAAMSAAEQGTFTDAIP